MPTLIPSISYTTRPPRPGEQDGVDYYFVSPETFQQKIHQEELAEWALVYGYLYGTPLKELRDHIESGRDILLDIDIQGAKNLRQKFPNAVTIFVLPPSWDILEKRLRSRNTDSPEEMTKRLAQARYEITHCKEYDYLIINEELDEAVSQICSVIIAERCRVAKVLLTLRERFPQVAEGC
jgi:guanylate kinase